MAKLPSCYSLADNCVVGCLLQHLESKAEQRNPDEFYFAMEKAKTKDGVHIQRYAGWFHLNLRWHDQLHTTLSSSSDSLQMQHVSLPAWRKVTGAAEPSCM
jgi:hypothetical protein